MPGADWRDLVPLLLTFPDLKQAAGADAEIFSVWHTLVRMEIEAEDEDDEI